MQPQPCDMTVIVNKDEGTAIVRCENAYAMSVMKESEFVRDDPAHPMKLGDIVISDIVDAMTFALIAATDGIEVRVCYKGEEHLFGNVLCDVPNCLQIGDYLVRAGDVSNRACPECHEKVYGGAGWLITNGVRMTDDGQLVRFDDHGRCLTCGTQVNASGLCGNCDREKIERLAS